MNFETIEVCGFEGAICGMRNPLKSYSRSDSCFCDEDYYTIGERDYELASKLCKAGSEHRKFLQMIQVWVDITAPRYFWSEFDTYRVGIVKNSESTMHTLKKDNLDLECVEFEWGFDNDCDIIMENILSNLRTVQNKLNTTEEYKDHYHRILKAILPEGFLQKRTVNVNYETLGNMYRQRKNHRLPEWSVDFTQWIQTLPSNEFITLNFDN